MKKARQRKFRLCIYLVKENYTRDKIVRDPTALREMNIRGHSDMILYVRESVAFPPKWIDFFKNNVEDDLSDIMNSSSAGALIVDSDRRYFVFTFGYGRNLLNQNCLEETFGLKVVLNSVIPDKLKSIDKKNLDTVLRYSRVQTSKVTAIDSFGMNIEQDILSAVTGKSHEPDFGKLISGSVAVHIGIHTDIEHLKDLCSNLLAKFNENTYKETFGWVDQIHAIKDGAKINELNDLLINSIRSQDSEYDRLFLAIPDLIDWEQFGGFKFRQRDELREDIFFADALELYRMNAAEVTLKWLKTRRVLCVSKDSDQIIGSWTLYKSINFETKRNTSIYLLHGGKWFAIDANFATNVQKHLNLVNDYKGFKFPLYKREGEPSYNRKVARKHSRQCILMDKKNIAYGGGKSKIEFCDLLINKCDFVHVKRFRGSSALSHLWWQGLNAATIFLQDASFVAKLNKKVAPRVVFPNVGSINASEYHVVFAVISEVKENIKKSLPFFSKVSFLYTYKQLRAYGFQVSLAKIDTINN